MPKCIKDRIRKLKKEGKVENKDFRIVYYGIQAEIKEMGNWCNE